MTKKIFTLILVAVVVGGLLTACERPAPLPATVPTETVGIPFPIGDKPTVPVGQIGTQTAVAKTPGVIALTPTAGKPGPAVATQPQAAQPTAKPTAAQVLPTKAPAGPTATPKPVVVVPTPSRPDNYTVQFGDTFYCIARRYNLNVADFLNLNGLGSNSFAQSGQTVKIPQSGTWQSGSRSLHAHPDTYTVAAGDSLNRIACYYGDVYPEVILQANDLKSAGDIQAGMALNIP